MRNLILISLLFLSACGSGFDAGDGKKIGHIVKLGNHGMFCSTYEGELIRGGFSDGSGANGNTLHFTVKGHKLYEKLTEVMENQDEVELTYSLRSFTGPCYSESNYIVKSFKVLKRKNKEEKVVEEKSSTQTVIEFEDDTLH